MNVFGYDGSSMVAVLPGDPLAVLSPVIRLTNSACIILHGFRDSNRPAIITGNEMDAITRHIIIEDGSTISTPGFNQQLQIMVTIYSLGSLGGPNQPIDTMQVLQKNQVAIAFESLF